MVATVPLTRGLKIVGSSLAQATYDKAYTLSH